MTGEPLDDALVAAAANKDAAALERLLRLTEPIVRGIIRQACSRARVHEPSLDDLAQTVLVLLHHAVPNDFNGRSVASYRAYVEVITRRHVGAHVRRRPADRASGAPDDSRAEAVARLAGHGTGPGTSAEREETRRRTIRAVAGLDDLKRRVVEMAYFEHRSAQEIADALGVNRGAVYGHLKRAASALKRKIRQLDEEVTDDRP